MAWTTTDLTKLEAAIASGIKTVKYADKEVTYNSLDEMVRARALIRKELGQTKKNTRVYATFDKGHGC